MEALKKEHYIAMDEGKSKMASDQILNSYIKGFISDIKSGKRQTPDKKEIYKKTTIKNFVGFQIQFEEFQEQKRKKYNFKDITINFYDEFVQYFNQKKYSPNTIGRYVKNLKTIMRAARDEGLHNNHEIDRKKFKVLKVATEQVYLTRDEIEKIESIDLSDNPKLIITRDVFLVGFYKAQRFSD